jgi:hypothetical protein
MYSSAFSLTSALDGVGGQRHDPTALPPGKTRYPGPKVGLGGCGNSCPPNVNLWSNTRNFENINMK